MILASLRLALGQMSDPRVRRVVWRGLGLSLLLLMALIGLALYTLQNYLPTSFTLPYFGSEISGFSFWVILGAALGMVVLSAFLMAPVAVAIMGFFLEDVMEAVERRDYPSLPPARHVSLGETLWESGKAFVLLTLISLAGLVIILISGGIGIILLWLINGYVLGRDYFTQVALRRLPAREAHAMRRANGGKILITGTLIAIPLSVPILNLFVPVLGAASFTHLYHALSGHRPEA